MEGTSFKAIVLGFIAGAIATATVHEAINWVLLQQGIFPRIPWDMEPITTGPLAEYQIPKLVSAMFWGGVWGSVFAIILGNAPTGSMTLKGILLGIIGPAVIGVFVLVPLITGRFPLFFDGDPNMIGSVLLILAGYGAVTAWLYGLFSYGRLP